MNIKAGKINGVEINPFIFETDAPRYELNYISFTRYGILYSLAELRKSEVFKNLYTSGVFRTRNGVFIKKGNILVYYHYINSEKYIVALLYKDGSILKGVVNSEFTEGQFKSIAALARQFVRQHDVPLRDITYLSDELMRDSFIKTFKYEYEDVVEEEQERMSKKFLADFKASLEIISKEEKKECI